MLALSKQLSLDSGGGVELEEHRFPHTAITMIRTVLVWFVLFLYGNQIRITNTFYTRI